MTKVFEAEQWAFLFHSFLCSSVENSGTTSFFHESSYCSLSADPLFSFNTWLCSIKVVGLEKDVGQKWKRQYMPHDNGRRHRFLQNSACPGRGKVPRQVRCPSCWFSWLLHPTCPGLRTEEQAALPVMPGKKQEFGSSRTTHKQVNKCSKVLVVPLQSK